jgi:hypothetical protein
LPAKINPSHPSNITPPMADKKSYETLVGERIQKEKDTPPLD